MGSRRNDHFLCEHLTIPSVINSTWAYWSWTANVLRSADLTSNSLNVYWEVVIFMSVELDFWCIRCHIHLAVWNRPPRIAKMIGVFKPGNVQPWRTQVLDDPQCKHAVWTLSLMEARTVVHSAQLLSGGKNLYFPVDAFPRCPRCLLEGSSREVR